MQREKISSQNFQCFSLRKFHKEIFCIFAFSFVLILTSCTNLASLASRAPTSEITLADPTAAGGGAFTLTSVLASQQSPGTMYDMVGADSQFDTYCSGTNGPCACEYTYVSPGQGTVTDQGAVQYQESNLVRCLNVVPSGVASFDVKVVANGSGDHSNSITVNLASGGFTNTNYTDLTKEEAYQQVKRFQCRKLAFIPNPMSPNLIDPIQSVDPKIIYPFNFYTSNVASSLWQMQQSSNQDWDCTLTPTHDRSLHWWSNPNVYSTSGCTNSFCSGDNELMYPQNSLESGKIPVTNLSANGKRRASFSLAKQSYGVFQIPVKAAVAPLSYVASNYDTIGYAARPIPNVSGVSTCPNITIPSNASWVKLWNFKANNSLPPRYVTTSTAMNPANYQIGCNPKLGLLPSCDAAISSANPTTFGTSMETVGTSPAAGTLASRVVVMSSTSGANACYNLDSVSMTAGQELWSPSTYASFTSNPTLQNMKDLPWGIYQSATTKASDGTVQRVFSSGGAAAPVIAPTAPKDSQLSVTTLTTANYNDNLFVVSDTSVNDSSMISQASSVSYYTPVTYKTNLDCNGVSNATCLPSKMITWDINIKDVDAPTGPNQYPLCVLQFTD